MREPIGGPVGKLMGEPMRESMGKAMNRWESKWQNPWDSQWVKQWEPRPEVHANQIENPTVEPKVWAGAAHTKQTGNGRTNERTSGD